MKLHLHKGVNGCRIQAMYTSRYFIFCQVTLLGVSDHGYFRKTYPLFPLMYIFQIPMDWIPYPALDS